MITDLDERYATLTEAAALLHVFPGTVRHLIKTGRLPARLFGGKYLIDREELDRFRAGYDGRPGRRLQLFGTRATGAAR